MTRLIALAAAAALLLAGCFAFDNPFDGGGSTVTFQVVVTSALYGGTYVWNPADNAYEATVGASRYYIYLDSGGRWCLGSILNQPYASAVCYVTSPPFMALPMTMGNYWILSDKLTSISDSAGGISAQGNPPDSSISQTQVLQVAFQVSPPGYNASYQWVSSNTQTGTAQNILGTGITYALQPGDINRWIRVIITPTDSSGNPIGLPVTSPPVYVYS